MPDIYKHAAADILGKEPSRSPRRSVSKARSTLALGFSGARRALQAMAANYRIFSSDDEANEIVARWRAANAGPSPSGASMNDFGPMACGAPQ